MEVVEAGFFLQAV